MTDGTPLAYMSVLPVIDSEDVDENLLDDYRRYGVTSFARCCDGLAYILSEYPKEFDHYTEKLSDFIVSSLREETDIIDAYYRMKKIGTASCFLIFKTGNKVRRMLIPVGWFVLNYLEGGKWTK